MQNNNLVLDLSNAIKIDDNTYEIDQYIVTHSYSDDDGNIGGDVVGIYFTEKEAVEKVQKEYEEYTSSYADYCSPFASCDEDNDNCECDDEDDKYYDDYEPGDWSFTIVCSEDCEVYDSVGISKETITIKV